MDYLLHSSAHSSLVKGLTGEGGVGGVTFLNCGGGVSCTLGHPTSASKRGPSSSAGKGSLNSAAMAKGDGSKW